MSYGTPCINGVLDSSPKLKFLKWFLKDDDNGYNEFQISIVLTETFVSLCPVLYNRKEFLDPSIPWLTTRHRHSVAASSAGVPFFHSGSEWGAAKASRGYPPTTRYYNMNIHRAIKSPPPPPLPPSCKSPAFFFSFSTLCLPSSSLFPRGHTHTRRAKDMNAIVSQRLKVSPQFFHTFGETFLALSCCEEHCFAIDLYQEEARKKIEFAGH